MLITAARLKNYANHKNLEISCGPGLVGVTGQNGTGKSSLLDALCYGITGVSRGAGVKSDNVTWGEKHGMVEIEFSHAGHSYKIARSIGRKPDIQVLTMPDGHQINKTGQIETELVKLFGTTFDAMLNNIFIPQGAIDSVLFRTDTERLKELQQTCGLTRAADADKALLFEISKYTVTVGLKEQLDGAVGAALETERDLKTATEDLAKVDVNIAPLLESKKRLDESNAARQRAAISKKLEERVAQAIGELSNVKAAYEAAEAESASIAKVADVLKPQAELAKQSLLAIESRAQVEKVLQTVRQRRDGIVKALAELGTVASDEELQKLHKEYETAISVVSLRKAQLDGKADRPKFPDEEKLDTVIAELKAERVKFTQQSDDEHRLAAQLQRLIEDSKKFLEGKCPTCKQAVHDYDPSIIKVQIAEVGEKLNGLVKARHDKLAIIDEQLGANNISLKQVQTIALKALTKSLDKAQVAAATALSTYQSAQTSYQTNGNLKRELASLEEQLAKAPSDSVHVDTEVLHRNVDEYNKILTVQQTNRTQVLILKQGVANADSTLREAKAALQEVGDLAGVLSDEEVALLTAQVEQLNKLVTERKVLVDRKAMLDAKLFHYRNSVEQLRIRYDSEAKDAAWVAQCRKARTALHVSGLPSLMMKAYASTLNKRLAYYLSLWEAPFVMKVNPDDDMAFVAEFSDGRVLSASRLSGGQKIVASTSFRFTMADTFARQVGMLVLDEPSNYLDKDNIVHLQSLLLKLKELAGATGRQIFIVTHEESLMGFFDHSIQLRR